MWLLNILSEPPNIKRNNKGQIFTSLLFQRCLSDGSSATFLTTSNCFGNRTTFSSASEKCHSFNSLNLRTECTIVMQARPTPWLQWCCNSLHAYCIKLVFQSKIPAAIKYLCSQNNFDELTTSLYLISKEQTLKWPPLWQSNTNVRSLISTYTLDTRMPT